MVKRHEQALQRQVAKLFDICLPAQCVWYAVPNGGFRTKAEAAIMKSTGTKAGVPDLCIIWRGRPHFIELKSPNGRLSIAQHDMHLRLTLAGAIVITCTSLEGVVEFLGTIGIPLKARLAA